MPGNLLDSLKSCVKLRPGEFQGSAIFCNSYSSLFKQNCSSAAPEISRGVAYNPNHNSPNHSTAQQQHDMAMGRFNLPLAKAGHDENMKAQRKWDLTRKENGTCLRKLEFGIIN